MKTNEWLSYLLEQHRGEFEERLDGEIKGRGFTPPPGASTALSTALITDFDAETYEATPAALTALAGALRAENPGRAPEALGKIWHKAEQLLGGYVAEEAELTGGARRLAYLRLSEFGERARGTLAG